MSCGLLLGLLACSGTTRVSSIEEAEPWIAELDLRVGSLDDPDYSLTEIRTLAVSKTGRIYTVYPQEQVVRVFEPDGNLYRTIGGRGDGPGEFRSMGSIGWLGDTLWVLDSSGGFAFSLWSEEGQFLSSFRVPFAFQSEPDGAQSAYPQGLLADGTVYGTVSETEGRQTTAVHVVLLSSDGEVTDSIFGFPPGNVAWRISDPDDPRRTSGTSQPYGDGPLWGVLSLERAFVLLFRDAPETEEDAHFALLKLTSSGDTVFSREYSFVPIPIPPAEADSTLAHHFDLWVGYGVAERWGITPARMRDWMAREFYAPRFQPPIRQMVTGRDGGVWLRTWLERGERVEWVYLDPFGIPKGRVDLPVRFQMLAGDASSVWGSELDELDVPYLLRFSIKQGRQEPR
jgi:hypothetical protein